LNINPQQLLRVDYFKLVICMRLLAIGSWLFIMKLLAVGYWPMVFGF